MSHFDAEWAEAEIRSCCRLASLLDVPLVEAAQKTSSLSPGPHTRPWSGSDRGRLAVVWMLIGEGFASATPDMVTCVSVKR